MAGRGGPQPDPASSSYQAMLGLRHQLNFDTFLRLSYTSHWQDFGKAEDTPRFDVIGLEFGWMF